MFERFTERARQVVVLAQEEARTLRHHYIGTEHVLLGLLREEEGLAAHVLEALGVTLEGARGAVARLVSPGEELTSGQIPFTPRAKKVLELALREALSLGHNYIGTEHILLGLMRENEGVAARILVEFGADGEKIRNEVIRMLSGPGSERWTSTIPSASPSHARQRGATGWLEGLGPRLLDQLSDEIRKAFDRPPDLGDLLVVLACARGTVSADALAELGVDLDALWATIERLRAERRKTEEDLTRAIEEAREAKERAIEAQDFSQAAQMRDRERELSAELARPATVSDASEEIRRRLGIPPPD